VREVGVAERCLGEERGEGVSMSRHCCLGGSSATLVARGYGLGGTLALQASVLNVMEGGGGGGIENV